MPSTVPPAPFAGRSRLTLRFRFQFQSQSRQPGMLGTLARAPGCRSELSTGQRRGNASLASAGADRRWRPAPPPCGWNKLRHLRSNDGRSRVMPLRTARRSRALRGHILCLWIDDVTLSVFVVMSNPRHAEDQAILVATLRHQVEDVIRAQQDVKPASVSGVGVEDVVAAILVKDTSARSLLSPELDGVVVVGDFSFRHLDRKS